MCAGAGEKSRSGGNKGNRTLKEGMQEYIKPQFHQATNCEQRTKNFFVKTNPFFVGISPSFVRNMNMYKFLTSWFGLGLLPVAPGTWGSLFPAVVYMTAGMLWDANAAAVSMAVLVLAGSAVTVAFSPKIIGLTDSKDPGQIVSDEVAGQALTLLLAQVLVPAAGYCTTSAVCFGLFRFYDIIKPFPCKQLEKLPAGWGILADDIAAGLWAAIVWIALRKLGLPA